MSRMAGFVHQHSDFYIALGRKLREARQANGLNQIQASAQAGIPRTSLVMMEAGQQAPKAHELAALCRIYNATAKYMLGV